MADEEKPWYVQLLVSLGLLVAASVLLCVLLGILGLGTVFILGISNGSGSKAAGIPAATAGPQAGNSSPSPSSPTSTSGSSRQVITLTATPRQVPVYGRIDLSGTYTAPDGTTLQVQRKQKGPWSDFPTKTTVNAGKFSTYIKTGHPGLNRLRVIAVRRSASFGAPSAVSNVVTVRVG